MQSASKFWRGLWAKRESASSHFAWGLALELAFVHLGLDAETAFVVVLLVAAAWELGGEIVTRIVLDIRECIPWRARRLPGVWKTRALDVPPWVLGSAAGWIFLSLSRRFSP